MGDKRRIWSKEELIIAYYIANWRYMGLDMEKEDIVDLVIGNTSLKSLRLQVANFRYILGIEGFQKKDASVAMYDLVKELRNVTYTNVKKIVLDLIEKSKK